ncbi:MAG: aminoglycoside phosphotransferase [Acidimicrobiales bacterium]|nr:aminoglycoside phosphotransferase [Acidimicrobiales bacterium]
MSTSDDDLRARVGALLGDGVRVESLRRLSGGASRATYSLDAVHPGGTVEPLIVRTDPRGTDRVGVPEAALLQAAAAAGVPVPRVVAESGDVLVVERVDGETIPRKILRDTEFAAARPLLARQCGQALARIHAVPVDSVPGLVVEDDPVATWRAMLDGFGQPHPTFELALRWLEERRPPPAATALVHGDFRHGNLIVGPDGVRAVIDWELAHLGDPMEDLGWLCVKAWRFGVDRPVGGFGDYEELFASYQEASGRPVDPDVVRWWEVMGTLKWGIMCIAQAFTHLSGTVRSVELAAIGRRVCENEWDLLGMIR